ncbi:zinc-binding dehydrogenase [Actinomyces ruminis]|uniref:Enoyl reductase (ER) domain-containing protein n=1 Tax=Actinomyces ruminis TaxID=1937003 RepID=A0ABX4M8U0_9ACTO|nr:zinc-binding dehydrogenase [Actinomyces ruminis]PHP51865.1 hypothetical protein BW737_013695 [Actinomyces ruminis]
MPDAVPTTDAAALPCAGMTAYHALTRRLRLAAGQTILITAGAGGVGGYAVQIAHHLGARVLSTASPAKVQAVRALGADEVIDYRAAGGPDAVAAAARALTPEGRGVDAVLDTLDSASATANLGALAFNGGLAFIGGRPDLSAVPGFTISPSIHEVSLGAAYSAGTARDRADLAAMLAELLELAATGRLDTRVAEVVPLGAVPAAYARLAQGHQAGKLVCDVAGQSVCDSGMGVSRASVSIRRHFYATVHNTIHSFPCSGAVLAEEPAAPTCESGGGWTLLETDAGSAVAAVS